MMTKKPKTDKKIRAAASALLGNPRFLYEVGEQVGTAGVVGEHHNRLVLYLACLTSSMEKAVSVLVKGSTSTGKNNLTKAVLKLIPPNTVLTRSSFSSKALAHGSEELAGKILYLVEHKGGKDAQLFTRLLQSEGELYHESTYVAGNNRGTQVSVRTGAPVFISTTTDERVYEDDETRFLSIRADESEGLTREVVRTQFKEKRGIKK
jgi:hypothetical protein